MTDAVMRAPTLVGFTAIEQIGSGGLGDVYRAVRESTGGLVALKFLRDISDTSVAWRRAKREIQALVNLAGHPHVVSVEELRPSESGPVIVMEYAPGGSLGQRLAARKGPLSLPEVLIVGAHAASALSASHQLHIVHRDVKPQNLLIGSFGHVKLCDFGIATLKDSAEHRSRTDALSLQYASPEEFDDDGEPGPATDVYSLGATLRHLMTAIAPRVREKFENATGFGTVPGALRSFDARTSVELVDIVAQCLSGNANDRPTAPEMATALGEMCQRFGVANLRDKPARRDEPRSAESVAVAVDDPLGSRRVDKASAPSSDVDVALEVDAAGEWWG